MFSHLDGPTASVRQSLEEWAESEAYEERNWRRHADEDKLLSSQQKGQSLAELKQKVPTATQYLLDFHH